jgi:hypothetical protein
VKRRPFHANAQHDTSIASQIALTSQRDGQTIKGISILGMLFLPGTYISVRSLRGMTRLSYADDQQVLFSMSFFHFVPSADSASKQWTVSPKSWMYWVVTIPVTALTVGIWFLFQRRHSPGIESAARPLDGVQVNIQGRGRKAKSDTV